MYTRENPSPEYRAMVEMYSTLHEQGSANEKDEWREAEQTFSGKMLLEHAPAIRDLIERTGSRTLLDYGSGKGQAYEKKDLQLADGETVGTLQEYWRLDSIHCYDPGYAPFSQLPEQRFDGVICMDVLEHVTEPDLPWLLDEIFGYARRFVFANIACYPALKSLPNGQNAHCTVRPPDWWKGLIHAVAMRHTEISWRFALSTRTGPRKKLGGLYGRRTIRDETIERRA